MSNDPSTKTAQTQLRSYVERVERLNEERKELSNDIRDVYAEAKSNGFDVKALKAVIRLREQDAGERREHEAILATYLAALGMTVNDVTTSLPETDDDSLRSPLEEEAA